MAKFWETCPPRPSATDARVKVIIAPHAGVSFSGETAAHAYAALEPDEIRRVVIIGPSHHVYYPNAVVSSAATFRMPMGDVAVDTAATAALVATGHCSWMDSSEDEEEHSIEMHLPFLQHAMGDRAFSIVPVVVGALDADAERDVAAAIRPLLDDPGTVLAVSTDFCHWGKRFRYRYYDPAHGAIHESIEWLDREGMKAIASLDPARFAQYMAEFENTICGRHALMVTLHALRLDPSVTWAAEFTHYAQSNAVTDRSESSVSYAAGLITATPRHAS